MRKQHLLVLSVPHNRVCVTAADAEGRKKLAGYMLRAPLSLAKMSYHAASGTVIYRAKMQREQAHAVRAARVCRAGAA